MSEEHRGHPCPECADVWAKKFEELTSESQTWMRELIVAVRALESLAARWAPKHGVMRADLQALAGAGALIEQWEKGLRLHKRPEEAK